MSHKFGMDENVVPLIAPVDTAAVAIVTPWIDLAKAHDLSILVFFGAITAASADQAVTVTVEAATAAATGSEAAVAFNYRLSDAVGANVWNAIAAATSSGLSIATTDDNKMLLVDIDPSAIQAAKADARYVRVVVTPDAGGTATLVAAWADINPRNKMTTMESAT